MSPEKIEDGGPAFPLSKECALSPVTNLSGDDISSGMSLRDWFAGQALVGMGQWVPRYQADGTYASGVSQSMCSPQGHALRAEWCYRQADAMLAARTRKLEAE